MRRVAAALETGPSSLYAHVVNKEDLDELLIGRLCAAVDLPEPDPAIWRAAALGRLCPAARPVPALPRYLPPGLRRRSGQPGHAAHRRRHARPPARRGRQARRPPPRRATPCCSTSAPTASSSPWSASGAARRRRTGSSAATNCCAGSSPCLTRSPNQALRRRTHRRHRPRPLRLHHRPDARRPRTPLGS